MLVTTLVPNIMTVCVLKVNENVNIFGYRVVCPRGCAVLRVTTLDTKIMIFVY